jgi:hypothetical protein
VFDFVFLFVVFLRVPIRMKVDVLGQFSVVF